MALLAILAALSVVLIALRPGGRSSSRPVRPDTTGARPPASPKPRKPRKPVARLLPARLPAPISGEAAIATGGGVLSIGGVDPSDVSTAAIVRVPPSGKPDVYGSLAEPLHDAAAAPVRGRILVFGGGASTEFDSVEALRPGGRGQVVGHLPSARSDVSTATIGSGAFVIGGFDGTSALEDVLETADGGSFRRVASLRVGVRYAAVAPIGRTIYVVGGELTAGADSTAIQAVDPAAGRTRIVGHLPTATSHASAVVLGGRVYVLGGRIAGVASDQIIAFDPTTGSARPIGRLPYPVQNAAAAATGGIAFLIGGLGSDGSTLDSIATVTLAPR